MRTLPILALVTIFTLCSFNNNKPHKILSKELQKKYTYIPSGNLTIGDGDKVSIQGFYMMQTEVTNLDYLEFLAYLEREGKTKELEIAQIHNEGWQLEGADMKPIQRNYSSHPIYHDYPVVNITKEAALLYCDFLKEAINNSGKIKRHKVATVRLPTKYEWQIAAKAGKNAPYPWGGYYLRNSKGCVLANFNKLGSESIRKNYKTGEYEIIERFDGLAPTIHLPSPSTSFFPNDYGLYNMSGNVAEMIADEEVAMGGSWNSTGFDIQITSEMPFNESSPEVGFRPIFVLSPE